MDIIESILGKTLLRASTGVQINDTAATESGRLGKHLSVHLAEITRD
jgi:hypothetical protein